MTNVNTIVRDVWHFTDEECPPGNVKLVIWIDGELHFGTALVARRPGDEGEFGWRMGSLPFPHVTWWCDEGDSGYYDAPTPSDYPGGGSFWMLPSVPAAR